MSPQNVEILLYRLERYTRHVPTGDVVFWECPDGVTYKLAPRGPYPASG
jgi:type IV secretory pathway protease TraF